MKTIIPSSVGLPAALLLLATLNLQPSTLLAQDTAFTYQGRFSTNGVPFSGPVEFQFTLWDTASGGTAVATNNPASLVATAAGGLFTVALDFGLNPFNGQPRFLQTDARTAIGPFTPLSPRQPVTATPYAFRAMNLATNGLAAGAYDSAVAFNNAGNTFAGAFSGSVSGTFSGNGSGMTNVNAATLGGLRSANFWKTNGNAGANPTNGAFLGTTDNLPLEFKVNGQRALRLEPNGNVIFGAGNSLPLNTVGATISGGSQNLMLSTFNEAVKSSIAGGAENIIGGKTNVFGSVVGGHNSIGAGYHNSIGIRGDFGTIAGGSVNAISENSDNCAIGGGAGNTINTNADSSTIAGGSGNTILNNASYAAIPGGQANTATNYAFAAGRRAKANHQGAFVWADSTDADFASTGTNQLLLRAGGGVGINTANPVADLHVKGPIVIQNTPLTPTSTGASNLLNLLVGGGTAAVATNGSLNGISFYEVGNVKAMSLGYDGSGSSSVNALRVYSATDAGLVTFQNGGNVGIGTNAPVERLHVVGDILATGTITPNSDRNAKTDIEFVCAREILEKVSRLPISRWRFQAEAAGVRHVGPMAQDFHTAFGLGERPTAIATVDADGVALAAIQGLNEKLEAGRQRADSRIQRLEAENTALKRELEKLCQVVDKLAAVKGQP
jgi:hypothetical protein